MQNYIIFTQLSLTLTKLCHIECGLLVNFHISLENAKKKSRYLCNSRTDLHKIWHVDVERAYQVHRSLKISFQKSKMADSRYT